MISDTLMDIIRKEKVILTDFFYILEDLRTSMVKKDNTNTINEILLKIEEKSSELLKIDSLRNDYTKEFCEKNGIENNIKDITDFFSKNNSETAFLFVEFLEKLQDLALIIDSLREVIEFDSNFNSVFLKLININNTGKSTYTANGYKENAYQKQNKNWRG